MEIKIWIDPKFSLKEKTKIINILNKNIQSIIDAKFSLAPLKDFAAIYIYMTSNEEMVKSHDPSFDGLSSGQYMGNFPRVVHINERNWVTPPICWRKKDESIESKKYKRRYREYVILHEVIHTFGLEHPKFIKKDPTVKCPVIYPQTKCWKLKRCKANHRMDSYTKKQIKIMWDKETRSLLLKFIKESDLNQQLV